MAPKTGGVSCGLLHGTHLAFDMIESCVTEPSHPAVSYQGKVPPIDPLMGRQLELPLRIGYQHFSMLPYGQMTIVWYS